MPFPPPRRMIRLIIPAAVLVGALATVTSPATAASAPTTAAVGTAHRTGAAVKPAPSNTAVVNTVAVNTVTDATASGSAPLWRWPVAGPRRIINPYLAPATPYSAGHRGVDLAAASGQDVHAVAAGRVHFSGTVVDRPVVSIDHGNGLLSSLEPVTSPLTAGEPVAQGDVIGVVDGESSHCTATCLHLGARRDGDYISPLLLLGGVPRSVLLPLTPG